MEDKEWRKERETEKERERRKESPRKLELLYDCYTKPIRVLKEAFKHCLRFVDYNQ